MKKLLSIFISLLIAISSLSMFACNNSGSLYGGKEDVQYTITIDDEITGGSLVASSSSVVVGSPVTFTATADNDYVLADLILNGAPVEMEGNSYTVKYVLRDYVASANFAKSQVIVSFEGEGTSGLGAKTLNYGDAYGELPSPLALGKTFVRWVDEDGNTVTAIDNVTALDGTAVLTAEYTDTPESLKEMHTPFAITTTYYDDEATEYGVVWHTRQEPIAPRLLLVEGDGSTGFDNARVITGENFKWSTTDYGFEWMHRLVIDDLKFDTTYSVKFGDYCVDAWSKVYTFTTRKEVIEEVKFFFIADSQENQHVEYQNGVDTYMSQTILNAVNKHGDVDFIAHGGDVVNDGGYPCRWDEMLDSIEDTLFTMPMQMTGGNHAEPTSYNKVDNPHSANKLFNYDEQEKDPAKSARGPLYSFNYGPIHFTVLRSNDGLATSAKLMDQAQIEWFINDVTEAKQNPAIKWTIVMMHQGPIWPTFAGNNSNAFVATMGPQLMPVIDQLDIDVLLYGHNHYLDSSYPIVWDDSITEVGVDNLKVKAVTKTIEKVSVGGDMVDKFVFANGTADRGTVFHQTGTCGNQLSTTFKYADLQANLAKYPLYRSLLAGDSTTTFNGKGLQMYSYIEVDGDSLVLKTYGVHVAGQIKGSVSNDHNYYLDGFMLTK